MSLFVDDNPDDTSHALDLLVQNTPGSSRQGGSFAPGPGPPDLQKVVAILFGLRHTIKKEAAQRQALEDQVAALEKQNKRSNDNHLDVLSRLKELEVADSMGQKLNLLQRSKYSSNETQVQSLLNQFRQRFDSQLRSSLDDQSRIFDKVDAMQREMLLMKQELANANKGGRRARAPDGYDMGPNRVTPLGSTLDFVHARVGKQGAAGNNAVLSDALQARLTQLEDVVNGLKQHISDTNAESREAVDNSHALAKNLMDMEEKNRNQLQSQIYSLMESVDNREQAEQLSKQQLSSQLSSKQQELADQVRDESNKRISESRKLFEALTEQSSTLHNLLLQEFGKIRSEIATKASQDKRTIKSLAASVGQLKERVGEGMLTSGSDLSGLSNKVTEISDMLKVESKNRSEGLRSAAAKMAQARARLQAQLENKMTLMSKDFANFLGSAEGKFKRDKQKQQAQDAAALAQQKAIHALTLRVESMTAMSAQMDSKNEENKRELLSRIASVEKTDTARYFTASEDMKEKLSSLQANVKAQLTSMKNDVRRFGVLLEDRLHQLGDVKQKLAGKNDKGTSRSEQEAIRVSQARHEANVTTQLKKMEEERIELRSMIETLKSETNAETRAIYAEMNKIANLQSSVVEQTQHTQSDLDTLMKIYDADTNSKKLADVEKEQAVKEKEEAVNMKIEALAHDFDEQAQEVAQVKQDCAKLLHEVARIEDQIGMKMEEGQGETIEELNNVQEYIKAHVNHTNTMTEEFNQELEKRAVELDIKLQAVQSETEQKIAAAVAASRSEMEEGFLQNVGKLDDMAVQVARLKNVEGKVEELEEAHDKIKEAVIGAVSQIQKNSDEQKEQIEQAHGAAGSVASIAEQQDAKMKEYIKRFEEMEVQSEEKMVETERHFKKLMHDLEVSQGDVLSESEKHTRTKFRELEEKLEELDNTIKLKHMATDITELQESQAAIKQAMVQAVTEMHRDAEAQKQELMNVIAKTDKGASAADVEHKISSLESKLDKQIIELEKITEKHQVEVAAAQAELRQIQTLERKMADVEKGEKEMDSFVKKEVKQLHDLSVGLMDKTDAQESEILALRKALEKAKADINKLGKGGGDDGFGS